MIEPQPRTHADRLALAERISRRVFELHGRTVLAVGVYGSTARGADGPYSDLEMMVIVRDGEDHTHEWTAGDWKAGMANRALYSTGSEMFVEALGMPDRPEGFDALCTRVMQGDLRDPVSLIAQCDALWSGIVTWAEDHQIALVTDPLDLGA